MFCRRPAMLRPFIAWVIMIVSCLTFGTTDLFSQVDAADKYANIKKDRTPWMRLSNDPHQLKINKTGTHIAYIESIQHGLYILELKTQNIYRVTNKKVGAAFFWSPEGHRLFYREINRKKKHITSKVSAYDIHLHKTVVLDKIHGKSGFLSFDPQRQGMAILHKKGISGHKIKFPGLLKPKQKENVQQTHWLITERAVLKSSEGRKRMRRMSDDNSGVSSYDISRDGQWIAWATNKSRIYVAHVNSEKGQLLDQGLDPSWHPKKPILIYAGARLIGRVPVGYDIKVSDLKTIKKFVTKSQYSNERWPIWHPNGKEIIYSKNKTTDLYKIAL